MLLTSRLDSRLLRFYLIPVHTSFKKRKIISYSNKVLQQDLLRRVLASDLTALVARNSGANNSASLDGPNTDEDSDLGVSTRIGSEFCSLIKLLDCLGDIFMNVQSRSLPEVRMFVTR